jgi:hypothetical protein
VCSDHDVKPKRLLTHLVHKPACVSCIAVENTHLAQALSHIVPRADSCGLHAFVD